MIDADIEFASAYRDDVAARIRKLARVLTALKIGNGIAIAVGLHSINSVGDTRYDTRRKRSRLVDQLWPLLVRVNDIDEWTFEWDALPLKNCTRDHILRYHFMLIKWSIRYKSGLEV